MPAGAKISTTKKIVVIQGMIQVVDATFSGVRHRPGPDPVIGLIECGLEATEKLGHRQIGLPVPIVNGRVNEPGPFTVKQSIPRPEIDLD